MNRRTSRACVAPNEPERPAAPQDMLPAAALTELLVALGIMAIALTVFVSMLQLSMHSVAAIHEQTTASHLARSQLETIKSAAWPGPYPTVAAPAGYSVAVSSTPGPLPSLQLIAVRVQHDGRDILTVEAYKGQR